MRTQLIRNMHSFRFKNKGYDEHHNVQQQDILGDLR